MRKYEQHFFSIAKTTDSGSALSVKSSTQLPNPYYFLCSSVQTFLCHQLAFPRYVRYFTYLPLPPPSEFPVVEQGFEPRFFWILLCIYYIPHRHTFMLRREHTFMLRRGKTALHGGSFQKALHQTMEFWQLRDASLNTQVLDQEVFQLFFHAKVFTYHFNLLFLAAAKMFQATSTVHSYLLFLSIKPEYIQTIQLFSLLCFQFN